MTRRFAWLLVGLVLVAVGGCGSTVGVGEVPAGAALELAPGSDRATAAESTLGFVLPPVVAGEKQTELGAELSSAKPTPVETSPSGVQPTAVAMSGRGVTATSISVGLAYAANSDAANAAAGGAGLTAGDVRAELTSFLSDINARGGVRGRKLVPIWHPVDANSTDTNAQIRAVCADFTEDHHVFATNFAGDDSTKACMKKAGVLQFATTGIGATRAAIFAQFPQYVDTATLSQERMMRDYAAALERQHYFTGWNFRTGAAAAAKAKVGLLTLQDANFDEPVNRVLLPALARAGHAPAAADVYRVSSSGDSASTVAAIQSAVLRFRNDGVTHVIFTDVGGALTVFFSRQAASQGYYPRYGENTSAGIQVLKSTGVIDSKPLHGALGLGWLPIADLTFHEATKYLTPTANHCLKVLNDAGFSLKNSNEISVALVACDQVYGLARVLQDAGPTLTLATAMRAVDSLGVSYQPAATPQMRVSATQHDGVTEGFDMGWNTACDCLKYLDRGHTIPTK